MGKTLEREDLGDAGRPLERVLPTLQTSLTLPELPCTATAGLVCEDFPRSLGGGCRAGKFLEFGGRCEGFAECGFALLWWAESRHSYKGLYSR